ncbi:PREDICTED: cortexin-1 isoform X2 [Corvus brachyrhynchos]|uniref:cortexin-1 isoform X2 n=1 Tax=Corvus brachyrhynchos TaxID=85066 RepID=UPI0008165CAB|nr:PREDICTED: cortexin-1 isoform X2 [Corvus brachyrhynchos]
MQRFRLLPELRGEHRGVQRGTELPPPRRTLLGHSSDTGTCCCGGEGKEGGSPMGLQVKPFPTFEEFSPGQPDPGEAPSVTGLSGHSLAPLLSPRSCSQELWARAGADPEPVAME